MTNGETTEKDILAATVLDSLEHYRLLEDMLDNLGVAVIVVNATGEIILVNKEAEYLFSYHRSELKGQRIEILIPENVRERHPKHRQGYVREPRTRPMGQGLDLKGRAKDGTEVPVEISLSSFMTPKGVYTTATIRRKT